MSRAIIRGRPQRGCNHDWIPNYVMDICSSYTCGLCGGQVWPWNEQFADATDAADAKIDELAGIQPTYVEANPNNSGIQPAGPTVAQIEDKPTGYVKGADDMS